MSSMRGRIEASFNAQALMSTLGAQLVHVEEGEVHILLPFDTRLTQQHGYLHAGAITSVVDSACGYAALTNAPEDHEVVTVEFKINFVRPALGERFLALVKSSDSGKSRHSVCRRGHASTKDQPSVVAIMQATIMNVRRDA